MPSLLNYISHFINKLNPINYQIFVQKTVKILNQTNIKFSKKPTNFDTSISKYKIL